MVSDPFRRHIGVLCISLPYDTVELLSCSLGVHQDGGFMYYVLT